MRIGEKLKIIRNFRNLTQVELGNLVSLADSRIRDYELGRRTPKEDILRNLSNALNVSYTTFRPETPIEEFMESLFWFEESLGDVNLFSFRSVNDNWYEHGKESWTYDAIFNKYDPERLINDVPVGFTFNNTELNSLAEMWLQKKQELSHNLITEEEYFEWKINWPESTINHKEESTKKEGDNG